MKRRIFLQALAGLFAAPLLPTLASGATSAPVEMERVQYGTYIAGECHDAIMPAVLRDHLDAYVRLVAAGRPVFDTEYAWFPAGLKDKSDPLGQRSYAGVKFHIDEPKAQRDAEFAAAGWVPMDELRVEKGRGADVELCDRYFKGKPVRYGRYVEGGRG